MREKVNWKDLGLKEGDCLTFSDGVTSIEIVSVGGSMINVRPKNDMKVRSCLIEAMTHRLMRGSYTPELDVYSVWTLHGETLRAICTRRDGASAAHPESGARRFPHRAARAVLRRR